MRKRIFIDVETTGTEAKENGIIQLSGIIEIDDKEEDRFDYQVKPFINDVINEESLEISGNTKESILEFADTNGVHASFTRMMGRHIDKYSRFDKLQFIGYNARFDGDFIRAFFEKNGNMYFGSFFWFPPIDVMNMAAVRLEDRRVSMSNFKLMTVAKEFGINVDETKAHDAMYDIEITKKLFDILSQ